MAVEIKMPQLSDTMSAGKILVWKKQEGDTIKRGDILAEVETDKANLEIEAFHNGTLIKIVVPAGATAKVGDVISVIGQPNEAVGASSSETSKQAPTAQPTPKPAAVTPVSSPTSSATYRSPAQPVAQLSVVEGNDRIKASPLAKKVAEQLNVNMSSIHGSGPNGRIVKRDIVAAAREPETTIDKSHAGSPTPVSRAPQAPRVTGPLQGRMTPFSKMRETIARRMQESVTQAPHFYVTTTVNMGEAIRLREKLKGKQEFSGISMNHMVLKAVAYGIANEPRVNRTVKDGQMYEPDQINIGIITAIEDGLMIPVIKQADQLSLRELVSEARAVIDRARGGKPTANDLSGGTFSVSNMGMFDVENFTAIINPGQGGILAVSSIKEQPIVDRGQITVGSMMKATVSVDHRVIDGVMASTFLSFFKEALETPALLMV